MATVRSAGFDGALALVPRRDRLCDGLRIANTEKVWRKPGQQRHSITASGIGRTARGKAASEIAPKKRARKPAVARSEGSEPGGSPPAGSADPRARQGR